MPWHDPILVLIGTDCVGRYKSICYLQSCPWWALTVEFHCTKNNTCQRDDYFNPITLGKKYFFFMKTGHNNAIAHNIYKYHSCQENIGLQNQQIIMKFFIMCKLLVLLKLTRVHIHICHVLVRSE